MKYKQIPTIGQAIMLLIAPYELLVKYEALGGEFDIQQIKKDNDLMGKLSGDTKHKSGSDNHLKDWHVDNQSADTDPLRNTELDSATPNDGGRLKLK